MIKDDLWVSRMTSEYTSSKITKGLRMVPEIEEIEDRLEEIEELFMKRFGRKRGARLIKEINRNIKNYG